MEVSTEPDEELKDLKKKSVNLFRLECLETLSWPPCSTLPSAITRQNPSGQIYDLTDNLDSILTPIDPSTSVNPQVDSDGKIIKFVEETRSNTEFGSATVSMSINRAPFKHSTVNTTSIRGSTCNVPFLPGFSDVWHDLIDISKDVTGTVNKEELKYLDFDNSKLLNDVPVIGKIEVSKSNKTTQNDETTMNKVIDNDKKEEAVELDPEDMFALLDFVSSSVPMPTIPPKQSSSSEEVTEKLEQVDISSSPVTEEEKEIEKCINEPITTNKTETNEGIHTDGKFGYAKELEMSDRDYEEYKQLLPTMARKYPFSLDPFQQASVLCMERGESLFVAAHTSAGKTVVAEYAIAMCKTHRTRAVYTSPIKALSNQKFRDFKQIFDDVGLVTGDIQLHPEAFCLIMTTEILRSMLYNGSEVIRDLEWVVFDEVHYINNEERGHVWEEVLIMLPAHVKIVMLSATVPNCTEFADWVGRIKNRRINVISTMRRPVPLEHYVYTGQDGNTRNNLFKIIDSDGQFLPGGYNAAVQSKTKINEKNTNDKGHGRGGHGGGGGGYQQRGNNSGGGKNWPGKNDKNIYTNLVYHMKSLDHLPMVAFVFSRKRCDDNAQLLSTMDFTTAVEKSHVHKFFAQCVDRLKGSDKELPQVLRMKELCLRGFAVHHSGILPILKEVVELLFQKGYVKILFATETFAMGVNMPARCVVFDSIQKHDGTERRVLNPGEYTQMAGRAGRRGLDPTGTVIVLCKETRVPDHSELKTLMCGKALKLESKFRVTYSMLLNLLRVEQLRIEDMLKRSYFESTSLRVSKAKKAELDVLTKEVECFKDIECSVCVPESINLGIKSGLRMYFDAIATFVENRQFLWPIINQEYGISKLFNSGRYLIVSNAAHNLQNEMVVLVKELRSEGKRSLQVLVGAKDTNELTIEENHYKDFLSLPDKDFNIYDSALVGVSKYGIYGCREQQHNFTDYRLCELPMSSVVAVLKPAIKNFPASEIVQDKELKKMARFRSQPIPDSAVKVLHNLSSLIGSYNQNKEMYSFVELYGLCADINVQLSVSHMAQLENELIDPNMFPAKHCTRFDNHFETLHDRVRVEVKIAKLRHELSPDSLLLGDEYQNRLKVLEKLKFVGSDKMVSLKGRIACEIHHQELLITELILGNKFHQRPPSELAALLSCLTCQYNSGKEFKSDNPMFIEIRESVLNVMGKLESEAVLCKTQIFELGCEIRFDLMEVVHSWASGVPFAKIMEMTDAQEGLIVKCIQRLDEVCKDVRNAARIVGDPVLVEKMEEVSASIRRDIVFAASLYTSV